MKDTQMYKPTFSQQYVKEILKVEKNEKTVARAFGKLIQESENLPKALKTNVGSSIDDGGIFTDYFKKCFKENESINPKIFEIVYAFVTDKDIDKNQLTSETSILASKAFLSLPDSDLATVREYIKCQAALLKQATVSKEAFNEIFFNGDSLKDLDEIKTILEADYEVSITNDEKELFSNTKVYSVQDKQIEEFKEGITDSNLDNEAVIACLLIMYQDIELTDYADFEKIEVTLKLKQTVAKLLKKILGTTNISNKVIENLIAAIKEQ